jgi:signal transduction histidine kinase
MQLLSCIAPDGTSLFEALRMIIPMPIFLGYILVASSIILTLFLYSKYKGSISSKLYSSTTLAAVAVVVLPLLVLIVDDYRYVDLAYKTTFLLAIFALWTSYVMSHQYVTKQSPGKWLLVGTSVAMIPAILSVLFGNLVYIGVLDNCFVPRFDFESYYSIAYILLLLCAHVYIYIYSVYSKIPRTFSKEHVIFSMLSILQAAAIVLALFVHPSTSLYNGVLLASFITSIGQGLLLLFVNGDSESKKGVSPLAHSRILVPLVIVVLSGFLLVDSLQMVQQMIVLVCALMFLVGYIIDALVKRQVSYESQLSKQNTELNELNKTKNEFLSFATHQLKAPLTSLKWGIGALQEEKMTPNQRMISDQLVIVTNQMVRTVSDFLNSSKLESGQLALNKIETDLPVLIQKSINENIDIQGVFPSARLRILIDDVKIEQVISNLIDNALKYTEKGSITVSVIQKKGKAVITVADTGAGMEKGEAQKLFQKFKRGSASSMNTSGSGIGLFLGKEIVEMHGGSLSASSKGKGKGSVFTIELPKLL